jgi:hypothetical protein
MAKQRPLTHEERRALIEAPISITSSGGKGWGGASHAHLGLGLHSRKRSVSFDGDNSSPDQEDYSDAYRQS